MKLDGHEGKAELANAAAMHSETIRDVLGEGNYFLARAHVYIVTGYTGRCLTSCINISMQLTSSYKDQVGSFMEAIAKP